MTVRLTVDADAWNAHVEHTARSLPGLVPVVKGNGYGFGRGTLAAIAAELSRHDRRRHGARARPSARRASPRPCSRRPRRPPPDPSVVLTVGSLGHVRALAGWPGSCDREADVVDAPLRRDQRDELGAADGGGARRRPRHRRLRHPPTGRGRRRRAPRRHLLVARRARPRRRGLGQPPHRGGVPRPARRVAGPPLPHPRRHRAVARRQGGAAPRRRRARRPRRPRRRARRLPPGRRAVGRDARDDRRRHRPRHPPARRRAQPVPPRPPAAGPARTAAHAHVDGGGPRRRTGPRSRAISSTCSDR